MSRYRRGGNPSAEVERVTTQQINWGIIGCGNVTECKSGPAFNQVTGSKLVAVMRRSAEKARDYAARHQVP